MRIMVKSAWYDVEMRGRRLEAICKIMNTNFQKALKDNNVDLALSYLEGLLKTEKLCQPYVEQITGLNRLVKLYVTKDKEYIIPAQTEPATLEVKQRPF